MQAIGVEARRAIKQHCNLLGNARLDPLWPSTRRRICARPQRSNFGRPHRKYVSQRFALLPTHRNEVRQGFLKSCNHCVLCSAPNLFPLVFIDHVDHPLQRKQAIKPWRIGLQFTRKPPHGAEHGCKHAFVHTHERRHAFALN